MEDGNSITLLLVGDIMITKEFLDYKIKQNLGVHYPFIYVKKFFEKADIVFSNLECTLSKEGAPMRPNTGPQLYSPPNEVISTFRYLNCNVVSLGNNHINDFGENGLKNTREILENNGKYVFGAGKDNYEANKEVIIEKNGIRIAFLGYTTNTNRDGISPDIGASIATSASAGCTYYDIEKIKQDIKRVIGKADIICISLHWGYEYFIYPSPGQIDLAHQIIDAGASIIIGHHPHIIQGIEQYKHGVIFYSLGNFFFWNYYNLPEFPDECNKFIIGVCKINKSQVERIEVLPGYMDINYRLKILNGNEKKEYLSKFNSLSNHIYSDDYRSFWEDYKEKRKKFLNKMAVRAIIIRLFWKIKENKLKEMPEKISWKTIRNYSKSFIKYLSGSL